MSNFSYRDGAGRIVRVPTRYGDMNRQVAQILTKNSENVAASAPFIACYIKDMKFDLARMQDPTFVQKYNIRTRSQDPVTGNYLYTEGAGYTVETIMPSPWEVTFAADLWTTNTDQKLQLFEQIAVLFNPSMELQTTDNYLDWTSLTTLTLDGMTFSSRQIPQGVEQDIDILNLSFKTPIWITPPAKVKKLGIVEKIIANVHAVAPGTVANEFNDPLAVYTFGTTDATVITTPGNFDLLVLDNVATLVHNDASRLRNATSQQANSPNWHSVLDLYPGQFRAHLSQIRLTTPSSTEIIATMSLDPNDDTKMNLSFDPDTIPSNTTLSNNRGTVDAIIDPMNFVPANLPAGRTYLILNDINKHENDPGYQGPVAWRNSDDTDFVANANDIIAWDGSNWSVVFDTTVSNPITYITNIFTGIQYVWKDDQWSKSFEGVYDRGAWRIVL